MHLDLIMSDSLTGEILWSTSRQLACNFVKNDAGLKLINDMITSAIKGVRMSEHKHINCSISFMESYGAKEVPLPFDVPECNKIEVY